MSRLGKIVTEISFDPMEMDKYAVNRDPWPLHNSKKYMAIVYRKMKLLTETQRTCMAMYYFEGLSQDAIAKELGKSRSSVRTHLDRGVNILKYLCAKEK